MRAIDRIAVDVLKCALSLESETCLIGNVRADEIACLASKEITSCPKCGAEPWVNIDCDLCCAVSALSEEP